MADTSPDDTQPVCICCGAAKHIGYGLQKVVDLERFLHTGETAFYIRRAETLRTMHEPFYICHSCSEIKDKFRFETTTDGRVHAIRLEA